MPSLADAPGADSAALHAFKNHLAIIIGFSDLLLSELQDGDPKRNDILEIHKAAHAALALLNGELKDRLS